MMSKSRMLVWSYKKAVHLVSEIDLLCPVSYLSDIESLVSFGRALFEDLFQIYNKYIPFINANITTVKYIPKT